MVKTKRICPVCGELDEFIKSINGTYTCLTCGYEESMADADRKFKFSLTINKTDSANNGVVSIDGSNITSFPATYEVQKYTEVTLQATNGTNSTFSKWTIENIGTGHTGETFDVTDNPLTLSMICKKKVTAIFE